MADSLTKYVKLYIYIYNIYLVEKKCLFYKALKFLRKILKHGGKNEKNSGIR